MDADFTGRRQAIAVDVVEHEAVNRRGAYRRGHHERNDEHERTQVVILVA